jgi:hypothetical protein
MSPRHVLPCPDRANNIRKRNSLLRDLERIRHGLLSLGLTTRVSGVLERVQADLARVEAWLAQYDTDLLRMASELLIRLRDDGVDLDEDELAFIDKLDERQKNP